jgi:hypothetical protein
MDQQEKLYIKTLLWAYERHQYGFTLDELKQSIGLVGEQWIWWREMFITTNGNDRKLIDLYQLNNDGNTNRYTLNDKGMAVVLEYIELQEARLESQKANSRALAANVFAGFSLLISVLGLVFTFDSNSLTRKSLSAAYVSLQVAIDPQVKVYLKRVGDNDDFLIFDLGVENIGEVPLINLSARYTAASIAEDSGLSELVLQGDLLFEKINDETFESRVYVNKAKNSFVKALVFELEYQRDIDKKVYRVRPSFIIDESKIYLPEQAITVERLRSTVEKINEYSTEILPEKVYWQEI